MGVPELTGWSSLALCPGAQPLAWRSDLPPGQVDQADLCLPSRGPWLNSERQSYPDQLP